MTNIKSLKQLALGTAMTVIAVAALAAPAMADRDHDGGRGYGYERHDDHDWRAHEMEMRRWHRHYVVPPPAVVYAPPMVYAPPPPVSPGLNLIIPLHIH